MIVDVSIIVFEHHAILLPYSAAALFRCLRTLQFHTFSILKSIGTSKKSGLNPCNFTSAKPTVQHSEHLFEFENHVILSSSKPLRGVWISLCPFEYHVIYLLPNRLPSVTPECVFEYPVILSSSKSGGRYLWPVYRFENRWVPCNFFSQKLFTANPTILSQYSLFVWVDL